MEAPTENTLADLKAAWGGDLETVLCERCDWNFLLPSGSLPQRCPHCWGADLAPWNGNPDKLPHIRPPELVLPFEVTATRLAMAVQGFTKDIPFPPEDLNGKNLQSRLRRIYLPMWLVDASVQGTWQAEAGFDYEVVSHQDQFDENRGGWTSHQVNEGRIRWEPRQGKLNRPYHNVVAPALEDEARIKSAIGKYDLQKASAYQADILEGAFVRLPDRPPEDAWSEAKPAFQSAAAEECRQAAGAQHIRQYNWQPEYSDQNWTLLLLPLFASYYKDDEGRSQSVLVNGQSGQINGVRRASMKSGQRAALGMLAAAMVIFVISLVVSAISLVFPPLLALGVIGLVFALLLGFGAIFPVASVWWFNSENK